MPAGFARDSRPAFLETAEWAKSWAKGKSWFQVMGGFRADRGLEPLEETTVRGRPAAYGRVTEQEGQLINAVDWYEETPCGEKQYAVVAADVSREEVLRIAQSLK